MAADEFVIPDRLARFALRRQRGDLSGQATAIARLFGAGLAESGKLVLFAARNAELAGQHLRSHAHGHAGTRIAEPAKQRVFQALCAKFLTPARLQGKQRRLTHTFRASRQGAVHPPQGDCVGRLSDRFHAGPTQPIYGERRYVDRQAGGERRVTREIDRLAIRNEHIPEEALLDLFRGHGGALQSGARSEGGQFDWMEIFQAAAEISKGGARAVQQISGRHSLSPVSIAQAVKMLSRDP